MSGVLDDELGFANHLADRAAELALPSFRRRPRVRLKDDRTPVTEADLSIESMVRREVALAFPGDTVLGEEEGGELGPGRVWIVDPIDGTRNYAAGIQVWGTLLALAVEGRPVLGVVSAPALDERYAAVRDQGCTLNGSLIQVSSVATLAEATICAYRSEEWLLRPDGATLANLSKEVTRVVGFTDFWGHCLVARGAVEVSLEPSLRIWDWAALMVVVEAAGGRMTALDGGPCADGGSILSSNGTLHEAVVTRFAGA
jgi:histidinol-phosphatase